jgi:hypothetical protein
MIPLPRPLKLCARAHVYLTDHYHLNFIRRRRRGAEEVIIGGNAPRAVSKAVVLTAAVLRVCMASRPCCFLSFFFAAVSVSRPVLHCTTACWRLERERERAAAACEVYRRGCGVVKVVAVRRLVQE